ncbi:MAG: methylmalonyl Co-A mutase-associated GTPase MeaB [Myxococcota bacterium]
MGSTGLEELVEGTLAGESASVAEALAQVEDVRPEALTRQRRLLARLRDKTPSEHAVIGLTGPPGVGKSTLAAALIRRWLDEGLRVGMIAVDPSSRISGGALLGDRARLRFDAEERVFIRSMAAAGELGGLAPATRAAVAVLRGGFDRTLVETVGVGQSEVEIASVAETVVLVLQPDSGDSLQFMKAGILEIPDVLVVHKWDLGTAAVRTLADLEAILRAGPRRGNGWHPPLLGVSAQRGDGVEELAQALTAHRESLVASGELARRREAGRIRWALELFTRRYGTLGLERLGGADAVRELCAQLAGTALDVFAELALRAALE